MTSQERQGYEELYNNVWSYEGVSNLNNLTNGVHTFTPEMMATPQSQLRGPYEPYEGMSRCPTDPNANNSINGVDKTIPMFPPDLEAILERLNSLYPLQEMAYDLPQPAPTGCSFGGQRPPKPVQHPISHLASSDGNSVIDLPQPAPTGCSFGGQRTPKPVDMDCSDAVGASAGFENLSELSQDEERNLGELSYHQQEVHGMGKVAVRREEIAALWREVAARDTEVRDTASTEDEPQHFHQGDVEQWYRFAPVCSSQTFENPGELLTPEKEVDRGSLRQASKPPAPPAPLPAVSNTSTPVRPDNDSIPTQHGADPLAPIGRKSWKELARCHDGTWYCEWLECSYSSNFQRSLRIHIEDEHLGALVCNTDLCNAQKFENRASLGRHKREIHGKGNGKRLFCRDPECWRSNQDDGFTRYEHLKNHARDIHQVELPRCRKEYEADPPPPREGESLSSEGESSSSSTSSRIGQNSSQLPAVAPARADPRPLIERESSSSSTSEADPLPPIGGEILLETIRSNGTTTNGTVIMTDAPRQV
ncbi:MAG: hypothetical protein Q9190_007352 [Brigantiaea leucoxantha]